MQDYPLLRTIDSPEDLRRLPVEELEAVCRELRSFIVESLSVNPGHLASSLGVVELTVALHYVFATPKDRIVWDVGHQAYPHKILTGRRDVFHTNRHFGGIRPFPSPAESEYDTFACGHASNSISAALGMAVANDQQELHRRVVAVIGDGAMSGGLAFEGLNNTSSTPNNMLIVLNDNDMSIDRAVGGMEKYLLRLNTTATYNRLRFRLSQWFSNKGMLDRDRKNRILRFSNAVKAALSSQQNIFEGLNIRYIGPVDGHNVKELVRIFRQLQDMTGPKLLHVHTIKGKGYEPAEKEATVWHAPGKFDVETGVRDINSDQPQPLLYQEVFGHTLLELAQQNPRIVGVTPAMPTGCSMNIMMKEMPTRCFDVGIAEGHAVTFAAGMAKDGMMPFCNIYSSFSQRAYDNVIHDVALLGLHVVLCLDRAGLVGEDGATHHGAYDMAAFRVIPNLTICSPMDEHELRRMMYTAQLEGKGPMVIRYPRGRGRLKDWHCPFEEIPIGRARKLRDGEHVAVLTIGPIGADVEDILKETEQPIAHYDMRFVKPLDTTVLREIGNRYTHVVTIEDGARDGGMGSAVMEWLTDEGFVTKNGIRITRIGIPDRFVEHGTIEELRVAIGMDKETIKKTILS